VLSTLDTSRAKNVFIVTRRDTSFDDLADFQFQVNPLVVLASPGGQSNAEEEVAFRRGEAGEDALQYRTPAGALATVLATTQATAIVRNPV